MVKLVQLVFSPFLTKKLLLSLAKMTFAWQEKILLDDRKRPTASGVVRPSVSRRGGGRGGILGYSPPVSKPGLGAKPQTGPVTGP